MNLVQIKFILHGLSLPRLRKLDEWLHDWIRRAEEADNAEHSSSHRKSITERILDNKTYRLESVRCGKDNCRCSRGKLHGPYWYSYTRVKDKVASQYIGKRLPKDIEKRQRKPRQISRSR